MSLHNKDNFNKFKELKQLIDCNPSDKKLLKDELKENYYQNRLNSLSDLKCHMDQEFVDKFFGRKTMNFFGTRKVRFSKKDLTVTCFNEHTTAVYDVIWEDENISLIIAI